MRSQTTITDAIKLPKFKKYTICNLRGGIGKTTLAFNLSYLADNLLAIDTCPQGNLSYYFDNQYYLTADPGEFTFEGTAGSQTLKVDTDYPKWTAKVCDGSGTELTGAAHIAEAVQYRALDRKFWG